MIRAINSQSKNWTILTWKTKIMTNVDLKKTKNFDNKFTFWQVKKNCRNYNIYNNE